MNEVLAIEKTLSTNDLGANGTHQGGIGNVYAYVVIEQ